MSDSMGEREANNKQLDKSPSKLKSFYMRIIHVPAAGSQWIRALLIELIRDPFRRILCFALILVAFVTWTLFSLGLEKWTTDFAQAFATVFIGYGALETFLWNYRQKNDQFEAQREQERVHFERESFDKQFYDIQNRIASEDPKMRANAALRLSEMAVRPYPERSGDKSTANYPYFERATNQLAMLLRMDDESQVRIEVRNSFERLCVVASDSSDQLLLHQLINVLAETNRLSRRSFARRLANYCVAINRPLEFKVTDDSGDSSHADWEQDPLSKLHQVVSFIDVKLIERDEERRKANWWCLYQIAATPEFQQRFLRAQTGLIPRESDKILEQLVEYGERLKQSSEVLANALQKLKPMEQEFNPDQVDDQKQEYDPRLKLSGVFLCGTSLKDIRLSDADLTDAWLQGAICSEVKFNKVKMNGAGLQYAILDRANLSDVEMYQCKAHNVIARGADLKRVVLVRAMLWESDFSGSDLSQGQLNEADFSGGILDGTKFCDAIAENAKFDRLSSAIKTNFNAAKLDGATFEESDLSDCTFEKAKGFGDQWKPKREHEKEGFTNTEA